MATPKLLEAACKGSHASQGGPDDDGSDENFVYGGPENADSVTGAGNPSAPMDSGNNLKQLGIALHALDAGECNVDICAKNSPSASLEPVTHTGWGPLGGSIRRSKFVPGKHWIREPLVFSNRFCR